MAKENDQAGKRSPAGRRRCRNQLNLFRLALEAHNYEVLIARDGNQGLALIEREAPDLVILDMMMPKRSGFLVLERLKRMGEKKQRIIMITANEGARHKAYAEMLGVDDYVRKPFPMDRSDSKCPAITWLVLIYSSPLIGRGFVRQAV